MRALTPDWRLSLAFLMLSGGSAWPAARPSVNFRNIAPTVQYAGLKSCAASGCHVKLSQEYLRTPMGSSMGPANRPEELERVSEPVTVFSAEFDRYFKVFRQGTDLYQSEYQLDAKGEMIFESTQKLEYYVGGGMNGYSYLVRRGNHLFEAPLSYYSKSGKWELSPGYVAVDAGFNRPALAGCLVCHNGQPLSVPNREALYRDPPFRFSENAIGCEACHGPGELHNREMKANPRGAHPGPDTSIVNPAKLPARLADDVCMNCHQGGHTRVLQPGKDYIDFRPGMPLDTISAIFKLPLKREQREEADRAQISPPVRGSLEMPSWWKNSSMEMSKCYRASNGKLSCVTCHKIHSPPAEANRAAFYRDRCMSCHMDKSCALPMVERLRHQPANDCAGCHMLKRPVGGIAHSELTNHRIMRLPGQPLPDEAFEEESDLPGLIHINAPRKPYVLSPLTKLAAYGEAMKKNPALQENYLQALDELSHSHPDDPLVLAALGRRSLFSQDYPKAVEYLTKAQQRGSEATTTFLDLGQALSSAGEHEKAAKVLSRGIEISPYAEVLYKTLVLEYITLKHYQHALEVLKRCVELFPEDSFMRGLLKQVESTQAAR